jgi:hypothetical protein
MLPRRAAEQFDVAGGEVGTGAVPAGRVPPAPGTVSGDVDLHDQLGSHEGDAQDLPCAPPGAERPARPRVLAAGRGKQSGESAAGRLRQCGGSLAFSWSLFPCQTLMWGAR